MREVSCVSGLIETVLAQYKLPLYYFIRRIELACLQSFERLAHNYISALESFPWVPMSTASFDEYNDDDAFLIDHDGDHDRNCRYIWLCKLVQECSLFQSDAFCAFHCVSESDASSLTKSVLRGQSDAALERVKERITEALSAFDETRLFALDCITCILFAQCSPSILHSFSRGQYASLAPLIKTLEESFSNWQNRFSRPVDYSHALEMCADKFVILLLTLIKKANVTSLSETTRLCMATDIGNAL